LAISFRAPGWRRRRHGGILSTQTARGRIHHHTQATKVQPAKPSFECIRTTPRQHHVACHNLKFVMLNLTLNLRARAVFRDEASIGEASMGSDMAR
jgi:hypothetical protein